MTATPRYHPHPGEPHEWSLPIPQLAGGRACRACGQLYPGTPFPPYPGLADQRAREDLARLVAEPYRVCPRFDTCSVNICPFDPAIEGRTADPGDRETKCHLSKRVRRAVFAGLPAGAQARLPFGGLHEPEFQRSQAARRRFAAMSAAERAKATSGREKGLAALKTARLSSRKDMAEPETPEHPSEESPPTKTRTNGGEPA